MAISYTWNTKQHEYYPTHNSKTKVVHTVHWRLLATDSDKDENGVNYTAETYGACSLDTSDLSSWVAYGSVDEAKTQAWVEATLGSTEVASVKSGLDAQIAGIKSPTSVSASL
tara:strand:+ start:747 stop:1085 length:339 start_codon:yes stop_codon:yes gene_type:complete